MLKQNNSSAICVMTFDNAFANYSIGKINDPIFSKTIDKQKRMKKIVIKISDKKQK